MTARPDLIVTGFGPFPRVPRNPSAGLAALLAADRRLARAGITASCRTLTVAYGTLESELSPILAARPRALLMLGVAARSRLPRIEKRAVNRISRLFPDASGVVGRRVTLASGAPHLMRARTRPVPLLRLLRARGLPARLSIDAGRYLCNAAYFSALAGADPDMAIVFVHIPMPRTTARGDRRPTLAAMRDGLVLLARQLVLDGRLRCQSGRVK